MEEGNANLEKNLNFEEQNIVVLDAKRKKDVRASTPPLDDKAIRSLELLLISLSLMSNL